jgi:hypothetical protein
LSLHLSTLVFRHPSSILKVMQHCSRSSSPIPISFLAPTPPSSPTLSEESYEHDEPHYIDIVNLFFDLYDYPPARRSSMTIRPNHSQATTIPFIDSNQSAVALTSHIITPVVDQGIQHGVFRRLWDMVGRIWKRCVEGIRAVFCGGSVKYM